MPWYYYLARFLVNLLLRIITRWKVFGKENIPQKGPLLVVANHLHAYDPAVLGISMDRIVIFMAKEELFYFKPRGYVLRGLGSFPVSRKRLDRKAMRRSQRVLADGMALAMFPEGSRSERSKLQPALAGSALIANRSGAPILPAGITGTERFEWLGWFSRPKVTVTFGKPFYLPKGKGKVSREELAEYTDFIMTRIAELLPPKYRGFYADKVAEGNED
jgi:1-acyl-sn-glycerol-3-phosphate acyltransferase